MFRGNFLAGKFVRKFFGGEIFWRENILAGKYFALIPFVRARAFSYEPLRGIQSQLWTNGVNNTKDLFRLF